MNEFSDGQSLLLLTVLLNLRVGLREEARVVARAQLVAERVDLELGKGWG